MCIGVPMQVISSAGQTALCQHQDSTQTVDILLVGEQPPGAWLLVFLGAAREVISAEEAQQTLNALSALEVVAGGSDQVDHLFADLIDREPQLPEHLRALINTQKVDKQKNDTPEVDIQKQER